MPDLQAYYDENAQQARQHEDQRERMTNIILSISGLLVGLITFGRLEFWTWPAALSLCALGVFGFMFAGKHYERNRFHNAIMKTVREEMDKLAENPDDPDDPPLSLEEIRSIGGKHHYDKFRWPRIAARKSREEAPSWIARQRTHVFWETVHIIVGLLGLVLFAVIMWNRYAAVVPIVPAYNAG